MDANRPVARGVDVRNQEERDGEGEGHDQGEEEGLLVHPEADEQVAEDGDGDQQRPRAGGDLVPPGRLREALRVEDAVHAGGDEGRDGRLLGRGVRRHQRPHLRLEP